MALLVSSLQMELTSKSMNSLHFLANGLVISLNMQVYDTRLVWYPDRMDCVGEWGHMRQVTGQTYQSAGMV